MSFDNHKLATALLYFLGAWLFKSTTELPEKYVLKSDFVHFENKIDNKLDKINDKLDNLMKGK